MKHTLYITAIAAVALMLCGCQRESLTDIVGSQSDDVVKFVPTLSGGSGDARSKGTLYNESNSPVSLGKYFSEFMVVAWNSTPEERVIPDKYALGEDADHGFASAGYISGDGVNGYYQKVVRRNKTDYDATDNPNAQYWMTVQPQTSSASDAPEQADDEYIWKSGETKTFFAYANLPQNGATMANTASSQTLTYTEVPADASDQADILLGFYKGNGGGTGTAGIVFYHPLTAVKFIRGEMDESLKIKSISLEGVASRGTAKMEVVKPAPNMDETVNITWNYIGTYSHTVSQSAEAGLSVDATSKLVGEPFIIIPQNVVKNEVNVTVTLTDGTSGTTTIPAGDTGEWQAGKTNTYTLNYGSATDFTLTVTPWDEDGDAKLALDDETGLLPGKFSVSPTKYVRFSKGNLRATRTSSTSTDWKLSFFEHQYDYTPYTSFSANDTEMSLFNWGFKDAATSFNPVGNTTNGIEDWGEEYNRQHGLRAGSWRTLTGGPDGEWYYLLELRPNSHQLRGLRTVHGIPNCLVIVPDDFDTSKWPGEVVSNQQWDEMEAMGAVCLVPAGYRENGITPALINNYGTYWSSSQDNDKAYGLFFGDNGSDIVLTTGEGSKVHGYSVRLVQKFEWPEVEPTFVDLGLPSGTLWADMNLGARSVGDPGKHFAWGEISAYGEAASPYPNGWSGNQNEHYLALESKTVYSWDLYKWNVSPSRYDAPNLQLSVEDDAAAVLLGNKVHTPSKAQWNELMANCNVTIESNGYRIASKTNGNSIFIPYNGYYDYSTWHTDAILGTDMGHYWSVNNRGNEDSGPFRYGFSATSSSLNSYFAGAAMGIRAVKPRENSVRPKFIDLGLPSGTLWADRNVGAISETGIGSYGKYFAFGETNAFFEAPSLYPSDWTGVKNDLYLNLSIKEWYDWSYYKWLNTDRYFISGQPLYAEDDAATNVLGDGYVTPTKSDWQELIANCTSERVVIDGLIYYKFTGTKTGYTKNCILLPFTGLVSEGAYILDTDKEGNYWASNVVSNTGYSTRFKISDYTTDKIEILDDMQMRYGISVRAVKHVAD